MLSTISGLILIISIYPTTVSATNPLEALLMPGKLTAPHSQLEDNCDNCHQALKKDKQNQLCLSCHDHENIASDIENKEGFHGISAQVVGTQCKECHTDHEGRDFDITKLDPDTFAHTDTDFELNGKHNLTACSACHEKQGKYTKDEFECITCHKSDDTHDGALGLSCNSCHTANSWRMTKFEHTGEIDFALKGKHNSIQCQACHISSSYDNTPKNCHACHSINDVHQGKLGDKCNSCHTEKSWTKYSFNHDTKTDFKLSGKHTSLSCNICHLKPVPNKDKPRINCSDCHLSEDVHKGTNGQDCKTCHDTESWDDAKFSHDKDTDFILTGRHKELGCRACHKESSYETKLGRQCYSCHEDNDIHRGFQGRQCQTCHGEDKWRSNITFNHELSTFPLIGQHDTLACGECHLTERYSTTNSSCIGCHAQDDVHNNSLTGACEQCHNPNAWNLWLFDHNDQTEFPLKDSHEGLACKSCHMGQMSNEKEQHACNDCHHRDDAHDGRFGTQCDRCHLETNFKALDFKTQH